MTCREWNGFLFLNLDAAPGDLYADVGLRTLDNWPMSSLVTGHRWETEIACNWKAFWENYSECLHCPGIHPELCDMVPIYGKGIMGQSEALGWTPDEQARPNLRAGAKSWTVTGEPCGPVFPGLSDAERLAGYSFVTLWPSTYIVAHVDYVRSVRIQPMAPERTRLIAEWHFPEATLAQDGFDAEAVAGFAKIVIEQDGAASEMNQRGMRSPAFRAARLMPEEYEIHRFHQWVHCPTIQFLSRTTGTAAACRRGPITRPPCSISSATSSSSPTGRWLGTSAIFLLPEIGWPST